ncbi:MAG: hypothetical protein AAGH92_08040, partial [Planctomycetota bacterium]
MGSPPISQSFINAAVTLAVLLAVIMIPEPLQTVRPIGDQQTESYPTGEERVAARLWQDPLPAQVEERFIDTRLELVAQIKKRLSHPQTRRRDVNPGDPARPNRIGVMLVPIASSQYAYDIEVRTRTRYAVQWGLASLGYVPEQTLRLGVADLDLDRRPEPNQQTRSSVTEDLGTVAYEWFRPLLYDAAMLPKDTKDAGETLDGLLVIWCPEERLASRPLQQTLRLFDALQSEAQIIRANSSAKGEVEKERNVPTQPRFARYVLGPRTSDLYWAMKREYADLNRATDQAAGSPQQGDISKREASDILATLREFAGTSSPLFVAPTPTVWEAVLHASTQPIERGRDRLWENLIRRVSTTDDVLCKALIEELKRRGVDPANPNHRVALISEWDTLYGRALPLTFQTHYEAEARRLVDPDEIINEDQLIASAMRIEENENTWTSRVIRLHYLRGIDGRLPGDRDDKQTALPALMTRPSVAAAGVPLPQGNPLSGTYRSPIEGRSRLDYLERLAENLRNHIGDADSGRTGPERGLISRSVQPVKLRAIGVLGADVYDKLLVIQALRQRFPHAIFFTTGMDATLYHERQTPYTRHLVVADGWSLQPDRGYASEEADGSTTNRGFPLASPPPVFRDASQTAVAIAVRQALKGQANNSNHVELAEIGRNGPIHLDQANEPRDPDRPAPVLAIFYLLLLPAALLCMLYSGMMVSLEALVYLSRQSRPSWLPVPEPVEPLLAAIKRWLKRLEKDRNAVARWLDMRGDYTKIAQVLLVALYCVSGSILGLGVVIWARGYWREGGESIFFGWEMVWSGVSLHMPSLLRLLIVVLGIGVVVLTRYRARVWHYRAVTDYRLPDFFPKLTEPTDTVNEKQTEKIHDAEPKPDQEPDLTPREKLEKDRIFDAIRRLRKPAGLAYRRAFESLSFNPWYVVWAWAILGVLTLLAFALGFSESLARSTEDRTADAALKTASGLVLIWTSVAVGWMTWTHIQFVKRLDPAKIRWEVIDADDRQLPAALRDDKLFLREVKDWMGEDEGSANAEESGNRKKCLKPIDSADPATNRHRELALQSVQTGMRHKLRADICQEVFEFLERALP